jgi:DNA polymerase IV
LRAHQVAAGRVTVKIRRADFVTYTRQRTVEPPTQETEVVARVAQLLLDEWLVGQPHAAVRLLGVGTGNLQIPAQRDLFSDPSKGSRLDETIDGIRHRFGTSLVTRASLLPRSSRGSGPRGV